MKRLFMIALAALCLSTSVFAGNKDKKKVTGTKAANMMNDSTVHWMTLEEVEIAMKKSPKKVWIDVYTDWCGWCKVMDRKTFSNLYVAQYMNEHFYSVKFDAEQKDPVMFMGKKYEFDPARGTHQFVLEYLQELKYPTSIFMDVNFTTPMPIGGYQDVANMEMILKYLAQNLNKTMPWDKYQKNFKPSWATAAATD